MVLVNGLPRLFVKNLDGFWMVCPCYLSRILMVLDGLSRLFVKNLDGFGWFSCYLSKILMVLVGLSR